MVRSTTWRRALGASLALLAVPAALLAATTAPSAAATGCQVKYAVSSQWAGGFNGDVTITNLGSAVDGWTLTWTFASGQAVSQAWNATVTQSGTAVTAKNAAYNAAIATNGTVNFGFTGTWTGSNPVPSAFSLNGAACTGSTTGGTTTTSTTRATSTTTTTSRTTTTTTTSRTTTTTTTSQAAVKATFYVAGDSTASIYSSSEKPRTGWGQALPVFFNSNITVSDYAKSGRSSKSFIDEGWLDQILAKIKAGDYLIISFGHNDEKSDDPTRYTVPSTTFKSYLSQYIDKSRAKGAIPILATPVERRKFSSSGVISASHGAYPAAMRELAASKSVPLVDLTASSTTLWNSLGVEGTKQCFLWLAAGASPNYPSGVEDNTHFQAHGAIEVARLVAAEMSRKGFLPAADFRQLTTTSIPDSSIVWP